MRMWSARNPRSCHRLWRTCQSSRSFLAGWAAQPTRYLSSRRNWKRDISELWKLWRSFQPLEAVAKIIFAWQSQRAQKRPKTGQLQGDGYYLVTDPLTASLKAVQPVFRLLRKL